MDHHAIAVAIAAFALAFVVAAYMCAHHYFSARAGQAYLTAHWAAPGGGSTGNAVFATEEERGFLRTAWRETVRQADEQYGSWCWWTVVVALLAVLLFLTTAGVTYVRRNGFNPPVPRL